jgi:hypothetical protein
MGIQQLSPVLFTIMAKPQYGSLRLLPAVLIRLVFKNRQTGIFPHWHLFFLPSFLQHTPTSWHFSLQFKSS